MGNMLRNAWSNLNFSEGIDLAWLLQGKGWRQCKLMICSLVYINVLPPSQNLKKINAVNHYFPQIY